MTGATLSRFIILAAAAVLHAVVLLAVTGVAGERLPFTYAFVPSHSLQVAAKLQIAPMVTPGRPGFIPSRPAHVHTIPIPLAPYGVKVRMEPPLKIYPSGSLCFTPEGPPGTVIGCRSITYAPQKAHPLARP